MKRTLALILAIVMVFALAIPAMATSTGSITIKGNDSINVENGTFTAYKMLNLKTNADGDKYAYTVPAALKAFYAEYFDLDATKGSFDVDVYNAIKDLDKNDIALRALAKAVKESGKAEATSGAGVSGANEYVISGLDDGYYLVYDSTNYAVAVSAIMIDTVKQGGNVDINVKADAPSIQKWIVRDDGSKVKADSASHGETINFEIDSAVPSFEGYSSYTFKIKDCYSSAVLEMDLSSIVVKIGDKTLVKTTADKAGDYSVVSGNAGNCHENKCFIIEFTDIMQYTPGDKIVITCNGQFRYKDDPETDYGMFDSCRNEVFLTYSCDPNDSNKTKDVYDSVSAYACSIAIVKTDAATGEALPGAEFEITGSRVKTVIMYRFEYEKLDPSDERYNEFRIDEDKGNWSDFYLLCEDGEYRRLEHAEDHTYDFNDRYWLNCKTDTIETSDTVHAKGVTADDGMVYFYGLGAGEYTITEVNAPDGYNKLSAPIVVNINYVDNEDDSFSAEGYDAEEGVIYVPVENSSGVELPSTGGIGTTIFYIVGGLLVIGAAVVLVSKKRMSAEG